MGRYFSIQMNSKKNLDKIIVNDDQQGILIEGDLGDLIDLFVLEDKLLEVQFSHGVLRLEINQPELLQLTKNERVFSKSEKDEKK
jgi:hypothetical protein